MEAKSGGNFEERLEAFTPRERENPYANSKPEGQWRWESDESKMPNSMSSRMLVGGDASRSYFHRQRPDPKLVMLNQSNNDSRSQVREEDRDKDRDVGDEANLPSQTFEGLKKNFNDEIVKLAQ
ncbi:hypothetical protein RIF29_15172 [Crotalaria pallida]|uniref:Uncharacterized protein n=1 Tax=Crotalaria pallida TaxID=3830 RepID=A0AAN9FLB8_CROPI